MVSAAREDPARSRGISRHGPCCDTGLRAGVHGKTIQPGELVPEMGIAIHAKVEHRHDNSP